VFCPSRCEWKHSLFVFGVFGHQFVWQGGRLQCALQLQYPVMSKWSQMLAYLFLQFCVAFLFYKPAAKKKKTENEK
jgi:hypothetical protein